MRTKKVRFIPIVVLSGLLAACSTTHPPAPVVDRAAGNKVTEVTKSGTSASQSVPAKQIDGRGYYTVKKGDTLIQIALDFGQNYRDLVVWNNLSNPNDIKVDQVLRVLPPEAGTAQSGVQTGSVTVTSGVEVRPSTVPAPAQNNASAPNKVGPRGDKRAYSEAMFAEMKKQGDGGTGVNSTANLPAPIQNSMKNEPSKVAEKSPDGVPGTVADDEGISWMWPVEGKVIASFSDSRKGIDIAGKLGQPVVAAGAGKVLYAGSGIRGYGNLVIVKHTNNLLSAYAHNKTIFVKEDQTVNKGQKIAEMGNSDTDAVKLHFEIRQQGKPVDPSKFLPNR